MHAHHENKSPVDTEPTMGPRLLTQLALVPQRWLNYWHGQGFEAHQLRYYRCEGCHKLVTWHAIKKGGCPCGFSNKLRPAVLSRWEKVRCLLLPWTI